MRTKLELILGSALLFLVVFLLNEWIFNSSYFEVTRGINWIYLPAGMRLLCTLLFGGPGAVGVLIASWITCVFYFFPDDPIRSFAGGIASAAGPYLVYKLAQRLYGLDSNLVNLTAGRLLLLSVAYSIANPALHHAWLLFEGEATLAGFSIMVVGDLMGTLVLIYAMKALLHLFAPGRKR